MLSNNAHLMKWNLNHSKHYIAVRSHQRSPWAHRDGGLKSSHIHEATEIVAGETRNNETQLTIKVQSEAINNILRYDRHQELMDIWVSPKIIRVSRSTMIKSGSQLFNIYSLQMSAHTIIALDVADHVGNHMYLSLTQKKYISVQLKHL